MDKSPLSGLADEVRAAFREEAAELLRRAELALSGLATAAPPERAGLELELKRVLHTLKGASAAAGEQGIKGEVHALEERLLTQPVTGTIAEELSSRLDRVRAALGASTPAPSPVPPPVSPQAPASPALVPEPEQLPVARAQELDVLRIRPERADALYALVGELVITRVQYDALARRLAAIRDSSVEVLAMWRQLSLELGSLRAQVPAAQWKTLDSLRSSFGAALSSDLRGMQSVVREAAQVQAQSAALSANLEECIRELRLMPLAPFFQDFAQVVREAARECGKQVRMTVRAEGAEIDRAVLMRLREPLLHLVRNAVVHGIEPPAQRRALGKSEQGTVHLEAHSEGTRVILRVADDGGGIDLARVTSKARQLKLLKEDQELAPEDVLDVLTRPGFSTRERSDGLAGRGIGLNVVKASLRELDGQLLLDSVPGAGCIFTVNVPVRAAASIGLLLRASDQTFCILLSQVERAVRLDAASILLLEGRATTLINGDPVAVVSLAGLLGLGAASASSSRKPVVILRQERQRLALLVDDIPGEQPLVIKPLARSFAGSSMFLGGAIQADGSVLPVLKVSALFDKAAGSPSGDSIEQLGMRPEASREATVLVVDDSLTIRTLLRNILQAARYNVVTATDGRAALEELARLRRCDLVITDLQMPLLDGVGVCRAVRQSAQANLPVMIVTSVGEADEKRRAMDAGADAYVIKAEFEQEHFLDLVAQLTGRFQARA
ncbi:MAG: response regulator [Polyangia bacterium]